MLHAAADALYRPPMNAARRKKLEDQLAATDVELVTLLRGALPHTAEHGDLLFFNSRFLPSGIQLRWVSSGSEAILALATESLDLREKLGIPSNGSPSHLYIAACIEAADVGNRHRRGPRQLAAGLIKELGADGSGKSARPTLPDNASICTTPK